MIPPVTRQRGTGFGLLASLLSLAVLAGAGTAGWQSLRVRRAARGATPVHFDQGLTVLDPQAPAGWTNRWCGSCHQHEYERWTKSRHALAGVNDNFQAVFRHKELGRQQWCLNCHAPANPGRDRMPTTEQAAIDRLFQSPPDWLTNGVDCLACHVRDGKVLVSTVTPEAEKAHSSRLAPELASPEFCAGCHQFRFKGYHAPDSFYGQYQQASLQEFLDFRSRGGTQDRCHDCHMPQNDHLMPGGYSPQMLQRAIGLDLSADWVQDQNAVRVSVGISARRVGHRVPGGEYFRFLTLHTVLTDDSGSKVTAGPGTCPKPDTSAIEERWVSHWPQTETVRRLIGAVEQEWNVPSAKPLPDTRLWPGEARRFTYLMAIDPAQAKPPFRARAEVWYHLMDDNEAREFHFQPEEVTWLVRSDETELVLSRE